MERQTKYCPYCETPVWLEPNHRQLYRCHDCGQNFTFLPETQPTAQPQRREPEVVTASPPDFAETPKFIDKGNSHQERIIDLVRAFLETELKTSATNGRSRILIIRVSR